MFAISNTFFACQDYNYKNFFKKNDCITLIVDASLIATAIFFSSQGNLTWSSFGYIGGGTLAFALDILMLNKKLTYYKESLRIRQASPLNATPTQKHADLITPCHRIMEGLYLGSCHAFMQTTGLPCTTTNAYGAPIPYNTTNPMRFDTVITVCPLRSMATVFDDFANTRPAEFENSFKKNAISWHFVGKMAADNPEYWDALIYDCTLCDTDLGKILLPPEGMEDEDYERIVQQKKDAIMGVSVKDWFKPIFEEIDKGVFGSKNVLVHCQAGISRSAAVLAAYLINRFGVTSAQAVQYLASKRMCVKPKFLDGLKSYENKLADFHHLLSPNLALI